MWNRALAWLGLPGGSQRAAQLDPLIAAINSRYPAVAGTVVSPETAARKIAVGASIRLISNVGRSLPMHAYRGEGGATERLPAPPLLRDPDATSYGLGDWIAQFLWSVAARGNGMAHVVERSGNALPRTILAVHPDTVYPDVRRSTGELWWIPARGKEIPAADMLHARMFPVPGAVLGLSPIAQHAATIGLGISAERFGADYFDSGGHPTALLKSAAPLNAAQARVVKDRFVIASGSREPVLLPDGISYEQIQIKPGESQFLDAQGYSSAECARIFGPGMPEMLGYETGGSMDYSNVVDRDLQLLKYTLDPYLVMVEQLLTRCLPRPQYVKFNRGALLRMNLLDRYRAYEIAARIGLEVPNEQRGYEDKPPVPWGDKPYPVGKSASTEPAQQKEAQQP
ncbi:phage portal protein [Micromonospora sp. NPDC048063]|uniref:phage portal protein n=1 Tax=Micromonospora sp. NPDC048063 TaxID=3364256 RepID=UPI0037120C19